MADLGWIEIVDWERFQHYDPEERSPPWIKVYTELHHDDDFLRLTGPQRAVLLGLWIEYAATRSEAGERTASAPRAHRRSTASAPSRLRADTVMLTRRLNLRVTSRQLEVLNHAGFIRVLASNALAESYQDASETLAPRYPSRAGGETEEETETEVRSEALAKGYSASSALPKFDNDKQHNDKQHKPEFQPELQQLPADLERDNGMGTLDESVEELRARLAALGEDVPA